MVAWFTKNSSHNTEGEEYDKTNDQTIKRYNDKFWKEKARRGNRTKGKKNSKKQVFVLNSTLQLFWRRFLHIGPPSLI